MNRLLTTLMLTAALSLVPLATPQPAQALYILGYGDGISITVKDAPQYQSTGTIRPDGAITIPYLGDVEVTGLTPAQLADRIANALKAVLRTPQVTVTVTSFKQSRVIFLGQVKNPGVVTLSRPNMTLFDAIGEAGGFTERAVPAEVVLLRGNGANAERVVVNIEKMMKTGDFTGNIPVKDGDRIQVNEVWWPNWGEIRNNVTFTLSFITAIAAIITLYDRASR